MKPGRVTIGLLSAALAGGCATVPREAGFADVRANVAERTGGKRVVWNRGGEADAAVAAEVRALVNQELPLEQAVQVALLNNRNLQAVYEDLMVAQADLVAAGLLSNPVFDAEIRFFDGAPASVEGAVVQDFLQVLYIPLRRRLASAAFEATKLRVAGAVLDLAGEVRAAYYDLQATQQTVEFRRQVVTATGASYELSGRMRAAGNVTELDVANERALFEQSKINLAAAEAEVVQDRERLNELMGLWGEQTTWTTPTRLPELPAPSEESAAENLERRAIERSLDLGAAALEIEVAARQLGIARPFGSFGFAEAGLAAAREDGEWGFGPAFLAPLPLFNQGQPAVAAFAAEFRRAQQRFGATAVAIRSRVRAAQQAVTSARARAHYYRQVLLPLRGRIVDESLLQYNAMQISPIMLLLAKQQQIDTANDYIEALREYWLARTDLDQILSGRLSPMERPAPGGARPMGLPLITGGDDNTGLTGE